MFRAPFLTATAAAFLLCPLAAQAEEGGLFDGSFSGNVGLVSDYVWRGVTQSNEKPGLQGKVVYNTDTGVYLGVWGGTVNFNDGDEAQVEINYFAGYANKIDRFSYKANLEYFTYPGADDSLDYDFVEGSLSVGYELDFADLWALAAFSPDFWGGTGDSQYFAGGVDVPLAKGFSAGGHVGHLDADDLPERSDWSGYVNYNWEEFDFRATYTDTDLNSIQCPDGCDERVVFSAFRSF